MTENEYYKNMNARQTSESLFYDNQVFDDELIYENFEKITAVENKEVLKEMGGKENLKNKKILDLGCGIGDTAIYFALQGASVYGIDISKKMINIANRLAEKYRVKHMCNFNIGAAENINFKDNYFDFVFGNGILHHADIPKTIEEVHRILKKNGKAFFIEPLAYNPIINIYRKKAKEIRSTNEKPLTIKDFKIINKYFKKMEHKEFWFLSLYLFMQFYIEGSDPNRTKYWKKIIKDADKYTALYKPLKFLDDVILKIIPPLRLFCWTTVIKLKK